MEAYQSESLMVESLEKRAWPRQEFQLPVRYRVLADPFPRFLPALADDLSLGGLRCHGDRFLSRGAKVLVELALPDEDEAIHIDAEVAWCFSLRYATRYYFGLRFGSLTPNEHWRIDRYMKLSSRGGASSSGDTQSFASSANPSSLSLR